MSKKAYMTSFALYLENLKNEAAGDERTLQDNHSVIFSDVDKTKNVGSCYTKESFKYKRNNSVYEPFYMVSDGVSYKHILKDSIKFNHTDEYMTFDVDYGQLDSIQTELRSINKCRVVLFYENISAIEFAVNASVGLNWEPKA